MLVAFAGALLILCGIVLTAIQLFVSIRARDARRDRTGDPWNGRTLEWSTSSPPPPWNFAVLPQVTQLDEFFERKSHRRPSEHPQSEFKPFNMPLRNPSGFFLAFFAVVLGFSLIWHIWWLAGVGLLGCAAVCLRQAWRTKTEIAIGREAIEAHELARQQAAA
jgi:cytochrome o ubiquinol oxidase subunit 1